MRPALYPAPVEQRATAAADAATAFTRYSSRLRSRHVRATHSSDCYNRYSDMFADLETVMRSIINCCSCARVSFKDKAALYDLWRFLNLLHVTSYCGVTATYSKQQQQAAAAGSGRQRRQQQRQRKQRRTDAQSRSSLTAHAPWLRFDSPRVRASLKKDDCFGENWICQ